MQEVGLRWYGPFDIDDIYDLDFEVLDDYGFYMFLYGNEIVYIGQAYYQFIRDRIKQHLRGDSVWEWIKENYNIEQISIKIATIEYMGQKRVSKQLFNDIESLLIITQEPPGNIQNTKTYWGRDLKITNLGKYKPLPRTLSTDMI